MKFKSQVFTQVSGSVGGLTYAHNQGGLYTRARSIPTNPGSPQQSAVRAAFTQLTNRWVNALTAAQRAGWADYAANVPLLDPFGDPVNVSGLAMYVRSNVARQQAAATRIDDAPTIFDLGDYTAPSFGFDATADEIDVTFTEADVWVGEDDAHMLVFASRPQNATINFFKGPYRFAGSIDGNSVTPPTSPAAIAAPFAAVAGQRIFVRVQVSRADGRYSTPFRGFADAA